MAERDAEGTKKEGWFKRTLHRLFNDGLFMEACFNSIGAIVNLVLAILNGYNGIAHNNPWSLTMGIYFLVLSMITFYVAFCIGRPQGRSARLVMRQCGVCLVILGAAMAALMYLYVIGHELMQVSVGLAWALTILIVVLAVLAIWNTYRFRKHDPVRHAFQRVTLAASIGGIVLLEVQLLATFGQGLNPTFVVAIETVTTIAAVAFLIIFGASLLAHANRVEDVAM